MSESESKQPQQQPTKEQLEYEESRLSILYARAEIERMKAHSKLMRKIHRRKVSYVI